MRQSKPLPADSQGKNIGENAGEIPYITSADQLGQQLLVLARSGQMQEAKKIYENLPPEVLQNLLLSFGAYFNFFQELQMQSRFAETHRDSGNSNAGMTLHSHTFYELLYCTKGRTDYLIDTHRYPVELGDVIILPPGVSHRPFFPEHNKNPYQRIVLWISQSAYTQIKESWPGLNLPAVGQSDPCYILHTSPKAFPEIGRLFEQGCRIAEDEAEGWEAELSGNTLMLIAALSRAICESRTGAEQSGNAKKEPGKTAGLHKLLDDILDYIGSHLDSDLGLSETAAHFHISESSLSKLFTEQMLVSFHQYVNQRRLIAAKELIAGGLSLNETAAAVGFNDYSVFYKAFKKEYGVSPRDYAKML